MNEHGQIFLGLSDVPRSIPWHFGQFERVVLLTALELLSKAAVPAEQCIDAPAIVRLLASKICSETGTSNGIFPSPTTESRSCVCPNNEYTSSPAILNLYQDSVRQPTQKDPGNNWQHAAVFCSLCRSLGIPCRIAAVYNAVCPDPGSIGNSTDASMPHRPLQLTVVVRTKKTR